MLLGGSSGLELKERPDFCEENEFDIKKEFVETTAEVKDLGDSSGFIDVNDETSVKIDNNECKTKSNSKFNSKLTDHLKSVTI